MTAQNARLRRCGAALLCLVCAAVMVRSAFVGLEIDEEYALSLGFRLVSGDRLFYSMWEPHQLSSLPSAALLAAFMAVTGGTTGVLLFFRLVVLVCKAAMSYAFYREFRRDLGGRGALLAALVLFAFVPKWFLGPDYTGQQFHWTVAAFFVPAPLCEPRVSKTVARGGGSGLRLLRLSGVPPEYCGVCGAVGGAVCAGAARRRALPLGHSPRRLAADRQLCRVRRGIFALCAVGRWV